MHNDTQSSVDFCCHCSRVCNHWQCILCTHMPTKVISPKYTRFKIGGNTNGLEIATGPHERLQTLAYPHTLLFASVLHHA